MSEVAVKIELPEEWVTVPLEDCVEIMDSRRIPLNSKQRSERIDGKSKDQLFPYYGATGQVGLIDDFIFEGEYLLIGEDGAPFFDKSKNVAYLAKGKFWVNNHAHILNAQNGVTSNKYLLHFLNGFNYKGFVNGTTRLKLNQGNLKKIPVPLAPPEQQKRIVDKIEELFSHIDAGIEALKKAKQLLKQYRQSVLKAAVTGELTKEWREANKGNNSSDWLKRINLIRQDLIEKKEITKPKKTTAIVEDEVPYQIPETWEWARLDYFVLTSVDCPHSTAKYKEQGKKCVRTSDFLPGKLVLDKVRYVTEVEFVERNKRLTPKPHDVLYSREGGILGIACMIPEGEEVCLGQRMMIFRSESKLASSYLMHNLNSPLIVNRVKSLIGGSASPHLNVGEIRNFMLPIPPKEECEVLLSFLDERLSSIERLEYEMDLQLVKTDKNKQSILASAFSGSLLDAYKENDCAEFNEVLGL